MYSVGGQLYSVFDIDDEDTTLGKIYDWRVIRRLPKYLGIVKRWMIFGATGMVIRTLASLAVPYLITIATDNFIQTRNFSGLNVIALILIATMLVTWGGQFLETRYLYFAGDAVLVKLRTEMFDHLQQLSLSFYDRNKVGRIMSRVQNDVPQLQELITGGFLNAAISTLTLVTITTVLIIMDARLALLTLLVVPVLGIILFLWQKSAYRAFVRVRKAIAAVNTQLQENISGVRVVQSLSRERVNFAQFDDVNKAHLNANIAATKLASVMVPVGDIVSALATGMVIIIGGYQVLAGQMSIGVLLGFLLYIQRFFAPVQELILEYTELQRAMVAGTRIFELLDVQPQIKDAPEAIELPPVKGKIAFEHVSFSYLPGIEVLHDIDLAINPGDMVAFVGRTGAGKSSLMSLIARFYEVSKGKITIDGYNINAVTQQSLRRQLAIVPQDPFLFSGTIEENIRYGKTGATHEAVVRATTLAGAHDFITRLEHGYETSVGERGANLSAGQRQLICLARAIIADAPILILDEATSNVDTNTERIMQDSLRSLVHGRTCLIIAHRLSTVNNVDRIIVLEQGRIAETGSHQELLDKRGLYYQMLMAHGVVDLNS